MAEGPRGQGSGGEEQLVLGLNQAPSMNAVLRALKREEASLFSCVASIADDAQFVARVSALARRGASVAQEIRFSTCSRRQRQLAAQPAVWHDLHGALKRTAAAAPQVAARYPGLPLLPNLRCGLWYVRPPAAGTCYFKSTDGHNNNWSFSTVRLNLNVAQAAASAGGCLIVDATKRGKVRRAVT